MLPFSPRIHQAMDLAARAHQDQYRKDNDCRIPYAAHVFGVAYLLAEFGFDEDVVVAGLLHDVLEDQPEYMADVESFGPRVLGLVRAVSEQKKDASGQEGPWEERKRDYIEHLRTARPEARAISCADKIHNMQSILLSIQRGRPVWPVLTNQDPLEQVQRLVWLREALAEGWDHPILAAYDATLDRLRPEARKAARLLPSPPGGGRGRG